VRLERVRRSLVAGFLALGALILAIAWTVSGSYRVLLIVAACILLLVLSAAWFRVNRAGPETLTTQRSIASRLAKLRDGASAIYAIWSGEYDADEVGNYFRDEREALRRNDRLTITRVINPSVVPDEHYHLLQEIRSEYKDRYLLYEDSTIRAFELFVAEYPNETERAPVAVVIVNDSIDSRPHVGVVLDPQRDAHVAGAVVSVKTWLEAIREGLPLYDPVAIDRWEHLASLYTRFVTENANQIDFITKFSSEEREHVAQMLQSLGGQGIPITVIEIGCGDGRALLSYIPVDLAPEVSYVVGLDYAPAMIQCAEDELGHRRRLTETSLPNARTLIERTGFFELNVLNLRRFFNDGRIEALESLKQAAHCQTPLDVDATTFAGSRKVYCCLFNTLGVIAPDARRRVALEAMLGALGVGDLLLLSAFDASRFGQEAPSLYRGLNDMLEVPVLDEHFDYESTTFEQPGVPGYYSRWFTESDLRAIITEACQSHVRAGRLFDLPTVTTMLSGGLFATIRRQA
jgi:SAM-dependent methyltransferase